MKPGTRVLLDRRLNRAEPCRLGTVVAWKAASKLRNEGWLRVKFDNSIQIETVHPDRLSFAEPLKSR